MAPVDEQATRELAYAHLTRVAELIGADRLQDAADAANALLAVFAQQDDQAPLAGYGTMLLDACFWLLSAGRDRDARTIAQALAGRLAEAEDPARRAVGAGGRFFDAQVSSRRGEIDRARAEIEALCAMGEPALAALDRIAGQFGGVQDNPVWHAQIVAATVTVLWRLQRLEDARALAEQAARRFAELGQAQLASNLRALAQELAAEG